MTKFRPLPREQAEFLAKRLEAVATEQPELLELQTRLLAIAGHALVAPRGPDRDVPALLASGEVIDGADAVVELGRPSECHSNVARLWAKERKRVRIMTGYALSDDGLWRAHSWALRDKRVVETTEPRIKYFGIVLAGFRALRFATSNW